MATFTLTYDDIPVSGGPGLVSSPGPTEDGFQFSNNIAAIQVGNGTPFPMVNAISGNQVLLEDYGFGGTVVMTYDGGVFSLVDTFMAGWNNQGGGGTITGMLNGNVVGQVQWAAAGPDAGGGHPVAQWVDVAANFNAVDTVLFYSGAPFVMDNTTVDPPAPIPEPATILLLMAGMLMATWFTRRIA